MIATETVALPAFSVACHRCGFVTAIWQCRKWHGHWHCPLCWDRTAGHRFRDRLCEVYGLSPDELRLLLRDRTERRRMLRERPRLRLCLEEAREALEARMASR